MKEAIHATSSTHPTLDTSLSLSNNDEYSKETKEFHSQLCLLFLSFLVFLFNQVKSVFYEYIIILINLSVRTPRWLLATVSVIEAMLNSVKTQDSFEKTQVDRGGINISSDMGCLGQLAIVCLASTARCVGIIALWSGWFVIWNPLVSRLNKIASPTTNIYPPMDQVKSRTHKSTASNRIDIR